MGEWIVNVPIIDYIWISSFFKSLKSLFKIVFFLSLFFSNGFLFSQIKNGGFEFTENSENNLPNNWILRYPKKFVWSLDNVHKHSGGKSLSIFNSVNIDSSDYFPFFQHFKYKTSVLKVLNLSVYIKTENVVGTVSLYSHIVNEKDSSIGFSSLEYQGRTIINGTNDWKKYVIPIIVTSECRVIVVGGYLAGSGTAWFDDFEIEEVKLSKKQTNNNLRRYIDEFTDTIKAHALYSDSLDWKRINKELDVLARSLPNSDSTDLLLEHVISRLHSAGDNHSSFASKSQADKYIEKKEIVEHPVCKIIDDKYGYINVPGFSSANDTTSYEFAMEIQNMIRKMDSENDLQGWIVDLRNNTGGNMYPMMAGLGPLLGNGNLGYFIYPKSNSMENWFYQNGNMGCLNDTVIPIKDAYQVKNPDLKIAVLIGEVTSSSGEMTAASFIGKPNVRTFGKPTGGFTTANGSYKLKDGSYLILASSFVADRNKKKYLGPINPDVKTNGDKETIETAIKWLEEK